MPDESSSYEFRIVKNTQRITKQTLLASSENVLEKDCSGGTFTINSQLTKFRGCTKITGNLIIFGFQPDFTIFKDLREITEDFRIQETGEITTISGFENLRIVGGDFVIDDLRELKTISGFANLRILGGDFYIGNNNLLTKISGFGNLRILGGNFQINGNDLLKTISGFANLLSVAGDFYIGTNALLTTISGFANLLSVAGYFRIGDNLTLKTISGFANLLTIGGEFAIYTNAEIKTISGFANLLSIVGGFYIGTNALLTTISGFANLLSVGYTFYIGGNVLLTKISGFANLLSVGLETDPESGAFSITTNGGMVKPNKNNVVTTVTGFGKLTPLTGIKGTLTLRGASGLLLGIAASIRTNLSGATGGLKDIAYVYPAVAPASQAYTKPASITRRLGSNNLLNSVTYNRLHNTKYIKMNIIKMNIYI